MGREHTRNSIALVGWTLGGVQTAGIQWNKQIIWLCTVWPRHRDHLDGLCCLCRLRAIPGPMSLQWMGHQQLCA